MPTYNHIDIARQLWNDEARFRAEHANPWLVWSSGVPTAEPIVAPTVTIRSGAADRPRSREPLLLEMIKGSASAFAFGITIGRTENNDVVIRHESVSRFHAYLQSGREQAFQLVDCGSRNGTQLDGQRLPASRPVDLPPQARLTIGTLELDYLSPERFIEYLRGSLLLRHA